MKNPIELKAQIQKEFENKSVSEINKIISHYNFMNMLNNKSFIFFITFIIIASSLLFMSNITITKCILVLVFHFVYYIFIAKKINLKNSKEEIQKNNFTIKCLEEIKVQKS